MQAACFRFPKTSQPGTGAAEAPNHAEEPHMSSLKNEINNFRFVNVPDAKKMIVIILENMAMVMCQ
jgi:hypothetical protein